MGFLSKAWRRLNLLREQFKTFSYDLKEFFISSKSKREQFSQKDPKVLILVHAFWPREFNYIVKRLNRITFPLTIEVTTSSMINLNAIDVAIESISKIHKTKIRKVDNQGRDVRPFLISLEATADQNWDLYIKLHTKRSQRLWFRALIISLIKCDTRIKRLAELSINSLPVLIDHPLFRYPGHLAIDSQPVLARLKQLLIEMGLEFPSRWKFPAGTMFAFNSASRDVYLSYKEKLQEVEFEYEYEYSQSSLAHIYERLFGLGFQNDPANFFSTSIFDYFDLRALFCRIK